MRLRYLFDKNVAVALIVELRRRDPDLIIWSVGDPGAPPRGTPDPHSLIWCEEHEFVLMTNNRRTMPAHLSDHLGGGRHLPGIFQLNPGIGMGETIDLLLMAARVSLLEEHRDQITYLPML